MNPLNDLIQSHEMYDPAHIPPPPATAPEEYIEIVPPVHQPPIDTHVYHPAPSPSEGMVSPSSSYYAHTSYPPAEVYYPAPSPPPQRSYREHDRETIHTMMREIAQLQRRLTMLLSSCEAMMERTYISHEYHHIARYSEQLHHRAATNGYTIPVAYATPPTPVSPYPEYPHQKITKMVPPPVQTDQAPQQAAPEPLSIKEGVFDGTNMISADGDMYAIPTSFVCNQKLIEGDILQAMVFATGQIQYKLSEPTSREHIMGILSTHSGNAPHYIVQTAHKAYKVLCDAVETVGATPGKQVLLIVPAGGESEWAAIERVFG